MDFVYSFLWLVTKCKKWQNDACLTTCQVHVLTTSIEEMYQRPEMFYMMRTDHLNSFSNFMVMDTWILFLFDQLDRLCHFKTLKIKSLRIFLSTSEVEGSVFSSGRGNPISGETPPSTLDKTLDARFVITILAQNSLSSFNLCWSLSHCRQKHVRYHLYFIGKTNITCA